MGVGENTRGLEFIIYLILIIMITISAAVQNIIMEYVIIPPNRYDDVIEHLKHNFFADEPLNASIKLCESGEGHAELEKHSLKTLQDGLSVMAVTSDDEVIYFCRKSSYFLWILFRIFLQFSIQSDNFVFLPLSYNQIAGVCLNGILQKGDIETSLANLHLKDDEKFRKIFTLLYTENLKNDLFEKYHIDKIFEIRILSVDSKFRGHGVAGSLMLKSKLVAEENGFRVLLYILKLHILWENL